MLPGADVPALLEPPELPLHERVVRRVPVRRDEGPPPVHGGPQGPSVPPPRGGGTGEPGRGRAAIPAVALGTEETNPQAQVLVRVHVRVRDVRVPFRDPRLGLRLEEARARPPALPLPPAPPARRPPRR